MIENLVLEVVYYDGMDSQIILQPDPSVLSRQTECSFIYCCIFKIVNDFHQVCMTYTEDLLAIDSSLYGDWDVVKF